MMRGEKHSGGRPWGEDDIKLLLKLRGEKLSFRDIADRLNRTAKGVQAGYYKFSQPEDRRAAERAARAMYLKEHPTKPRGSSRNLINAPRGGPRIPEETIENLRLRLSAPRTITGFVFGDPPIGFSALDMRGQR